MRVVEAATDPTVRYTSLHFDVLDDKNVAIASLVTRDDAELFLRAKQSQAWMWGQADKPAVPETVHYVSGVAIPPQDARIFQAMLDEIGPARFTDISGDISNHPLAKQLMRQGNPQELLQGPTMMSVMGYQVEPPDEQDDVQPDQIINKPDVGGEG